MCAYVCADLNMLKSCSVFKICYEKLKALVCSFMAISLVDRSLCLACGCCGKEVNPQTSG